MNYYLVQIEIIKMQNDVQREKDFQAQQTFILDCTYHQNLKYPS